MTSPPADTPSTAAAAGSATVDQDQLPGGPGDGPSYLSHRQILIVLAGVMAGMLLFALDQGIVGTALPRIVSELGGLDKLSWVVTAYLLTSTATTPLWGKISDLYGRRLIFQVAIIIFLVGSALSGLSQNMGQLIVFRAVQGIGGGGLFAIALSIIGDVIPPRERGRYQGYFGAVFGVSSVAGPLLGGWLTDGPGWRWIFYINIPVGLAALVVTSAALKMPVIRRQHSIDYLGAAAIVGAVTCLLLYLDWRGNEYGWTEAGALLLLGGDAPARGAVRADRAAGRRADHPPAAVPQPGVQRRQRLRLPGRHRHVRDDHLPARLPPGGQGLHAHPVRAGPAAGDHRHLLDLDHLRPADHPHRPLQDLPGHRGGGDGRGHGRCCRASAWTPRSGRSPCTSTCSGPASGSPCRRSSPPCRTRSTTGTWARPPARPPSSARWAARSGRRCSGRCCPAASPTTLPSSWPRPASARGAGAPPVEANNVQAIQHLAEPVRSIVLGAFTSALDDVFLVGVPFLVIAFLISLALKEVPLRTGQTPSPPQP